MLQFGWATASCGVTSRMSSKARSRNGPPLAVRMIRSIVSTRSRSKHCQIALCSLSTGSKVAPQRATSCMTRLPAQTSTSLLAKATMRPAPDRRQGRRQPGGPDDPRHHPVGRAQRRLDERFGAAGRLDPGAGKRVLQRRVVGGVGDRGESRPQRPRLLGQTAPGCGSRSAPRPRSHPGCAAADRPCSARPSRSSRES